MSNVVKLIKRPPHEKAKTMSDGFIPLFRAIKNQPWYKHSDYKAIFIHLLIEAAHKPVKVNFRGCDIQLGKGQLATSYLELENSTSVSKSIIQRALKKFESLGQISRRNFNKYNNKYTVITISNWSNFNEKSDTVNDTVTDTVKHLPVKGLSTDTDKGVDTVSDTQNNKPISNKLDIGTSCSEQSSEQQPELTNIKLPLNKKDTWHFVSKKDFEEYQELYPAVDTLQAFRSMYGWCQANPKRRKTIKGIKKFINNWLADDQDKGKNRRHDAFNKTPSNSSFRSGQQRTISAVEKAKSFIEKQDANQGNLSGNSDSMDETRSDV